LQAQTGLKASPDSIMANANAILAVDPASLLALVNLVDAYKAKYHETPSYWAEFPYIEASWLDKAIRLRESNGVKAVWLFAADDKTIARIVKAMAQQSFKPAFMVSNYEPSVPSLAGAAAEGWYGIATQSLFASPDEAAINPEVKLFQEWMNKVKPGAKIDLYALYSWSMGRMLFQAMENAGPKATRAGVIDAIRKLGDYSDNDVVGPANPGAKRPTSCFVIAQIHGDRYQRVNPAKGLDCRGRYMHF